MSRDKEDLVNNIVYRLADNSTCSIHQLKQLIESSLYEYDVHRNLCTELSMNYTGVVTDQLWRYFELGKRSKNISEDSIQQYKNR